MQDRRVELDKLRDAKQNYTRHITTNVKVLSEGIDVPALDAICFLEERKSEVDIIQAVGRVMRRPQGGGKDVGYIIVPVRMNPQLNFEDTLSRWDEDWRVLGQVLRALKAHDPRIETHLQDRILITGSTEGPSGPGGETVPKGFFDQLREGKFDSLVPALMEFSGIQVSVQETTNLIKNAVALATRELAAETGLGNRLMKTAGVADKKDMAARRACSVCALYLTNALLMHQRLNDTRKKAESKAGMISISSLDEVQRAEKPEQILLRDWRRVLEVDYSAIFRPAIETIEVASIEREGMQGLRTALRQLARHCAEIAERYVQQGMDHAGELFQAAMDNPDSDGAYYTLTPGAMLLAELTCDALADPDDPLWASLEYWQQNTVLDPACGSGTLLTAFATAVRRRAATQGASENKLDALQQAMVEDSLTGMDINRQALQIAASQLAIGTSGRNLTRMGLYAMPRNDSNGRARLGSLERLTTRRDGAVLSQPDMLFHGTRDINAAGGKNIDAAESRAVGELGERLSRTKVAVSNPPFSNAAKEGGALVRDLQLQSKKRKLLLKQALVAADPELDGVLNPNSIRPWFTVLMEKLVDEQEGILAKVLPTTALTGIGGLAERRFLADRFEIQAIITLHHPRDLNWSVDTSITESLLIARRRAGRESNPTRFIALLRRPGGVEAALQLHAAIQSGQIDPWGRECTWPADLMIDGDWSPAVWAQFELAQAGRQIEELAGQLEWTRLGQRFDVATTKQIVGQEKWDWCPENEAGEIPVARFTGMDAQTRISGRIDQYANRADQFRDNEDVFRNLDKKKSHLLVTNSQGSDTGRLTAIVMMDAAVGMGWTPVIGVCLEEARALAVYLNSTLGRIGMRRYGARKLSWPMYQPAAIEQFVVPDFCDKEGPRRMSILCDAYNATCKMQVRSYRDGYDETRSQWDDAVAEACGIDRRWIGQLAQLLDNEPIVTGTCPPHQS